MAKPEALFELFEDLRATKTPPADDWRPRESLDIGLRIAADGCWLHQGAAITRPRMVRFFAALLRRDGDGRHYLATPRLKYPVRVDDAPFHAVELRRRGAGKNQDLIFRTNVDDVVLADGAHPITMPDARAHAPYIEVRAGLRAKISRAVYYELAELLVASEEDARLLGVYSGGRFFALGRAG